MTHYGELLDLVVVHEPFENNPNTFGSQEAIGRNFQLLNGCVRIRECHGNDDGCAIIDFASI